MKSPAELSSKLAKQWHRPNLRVERLLSSDAWPIEIGIGKPTSTQFSQKAAEVEHHIQAWKSIDIGEVVWKSVKYQAGAEAVKLPLRWRIRTPSEWVAASDDETVTNEFRCLESIVNNVRELYWELLVRERNLWRNKDPQEVVATAKLADSLYPGAAQGMPLRLMAGHAVDTKFFERHGLLLTRLLDERFQGEASEQGLPGFLGAYEENEHWVLMIPLDRGLLPFRRQRVTTSELSQSDLPAKNILIVENEQCYHHLPDLPDTIAILGAGLDLSWLDSKVFERKKIGYWGDMDTWGLSMLSRARLHAPDLEPILMNLAVFEQFRGGCAVPEPVTAGSTPPEGLTGSEASFYCYLLEQDNGRLEQEYLPVSQVQTVLRAWSGTTV